jgi:hypothetical protein
VPFSPPWDDERGENGGERKMNRKIIPFLYSEPAVQSFSSASRITSLLDPKSDGHTLFPPPLSKLAVNTSVNIVINVPWVLRDKDLVQRVEVMEQYFRKRGKKEYFIELPDPISPFQDLSDLIHAQAF